MNKNLSLATFGGGCFWCTEAIFQRLKGVRKVTSGYAGGTAETANYRDVCTKCTDHAEVIQIEFDTTIISYEVLVKVHLTTHNPTTLNYQGADKGAQYRSTIFYHDDTQRKAAQSVIDELQDAYDDPIVTQLEPYTQFFKAEDSHQNYYADNPLKPYCQAVIIPKLQKFKSQWQEWIEPS